MMLAETPEGRLRAALLVFAVLALPAPCDGLAASGNGGSCPSGSAAGREGYDLEPAGSGSWSALNRTQGLRITISADGLEVAPLSPPPSAWDLRIRLEAHGPADYPWRALPASPSAVGDRGVLRRGPVTETMRNSPKGVLYEIEIDGEESPLPIVVEFALAGTLTPKVREDGAAIAFVDPRGVPILVGRDLRANDALGRDVAARWERVEPSGHAPSRLRVLLEAGEHPRPLRILSRIAAAKAAGPDEVVAAPGGPSSSALDAVPVPAAVPPSNDLCPGAETIPAAGPFPYLSGIYDLGGATVTDDPPLPTCQANVSHSVWFRFVPAASGSYTFSLCADAPTATTLDDTVLAVYEATGDCAGLSEMAFGCDDDSCAVGDLQSIVADLDLVAGTTYDIVAWEYGTAAPPAGAASVQLRVTQNPPPAGPPPNDRCAGAEAIPGAGPFPYLTTVTRDISGATSSGDPPPPSCQPNVSRSIWYTFTPAASGRYSFSLCADAPTGTTVDDTVMGIYASTGACSGLTEIPGGCDDDSCPSEPGQSMIADVPLAAGTTYDIVVWQYGVAPPAAGNTAIQLRVGQVLAPTNDTCAAAARLALDRPAPGTTVASRDDDELPSGSACFAGLGQTTSTAPGGDVVYRFTAPWDGRYSFRLGGYETTKNAVLYLASDCPAGPSPATVTSCLGAANRNAGYPGEEVSCLPLLAGQSALVFIDENTSTPGSAFAIEASRCLRESEPNDAPSAAGPLHCGLEGSIAPAGDVDFFSLGAPPAGSRVFAMVDGAAANSTDFDLRVTTATDTLEYDDLNDDTPFGTISPNVAGTPLPGGAAYLRVSHYSPTAQAEPYRLYAALQPPAAQAAPESEPNDTLASANQSPGLYFSGRLSGTSDVDLFSFTLDAGDLVFIGLDLDPTRDGTPFDGRLALLDASGSTLVGVNDGGATSSTLFTAGSLAATAPFSPAEALVYRAPAAGAYYVKVAWSSGTWGDYLLSIAVNCRSGPPAAIDSDADGVPDEQDCSPGDPTAWSLPGEATDLVFPSAIDPALLRWNPPPDPGGTSVLYDLLRGTAPDDFAAPACVASGLTTTTASDPDRPERSYFYLVRARNACGGNLGMRPDGSARLAAACP